MTKATLGSCPVAILAAPFIPAAFAAPQAAAAPAPKEAPKLDVSLAPSGAAPSPSLLRDLPRPFGPRRRAARPRPARAGARPHDDRGAQRREVPGERVQKIIASGENLRGHGSADMPAWGDVFKRTTGLDGATPDQAIRNLTHYLWSLQRESSPGTSPPK